MKFMNLEIIYVEYNRQVRESIEDHQKFLKSGKRYQDWPHVNIDYAAIEEMIRHETAIAYPHFSQNKINYIWSKVYEDYHSSFGECISGMYELCDFVDKMPK